MIALPICLVVILIATVVMIICLWNQKYDEPFTSSKEKSGCCAGKKGGCMCTNPAYFDAVCQQDRAQPVDALEGILVDARCYAISKSNWTNDHLVPPSTERTVKGCATGCASKGIPVGLLQGPIPPDESSQLIILLHPAPNLALHMEKKARVTGCFMADISAIFTTKVEVESPTTGEWQDVAFQTPMSDYVAAKEESKESFSATPTFSQDIRPLFREVDVSTMKPLGLDLTDYQSVKKIAEKIYQRLADGSMPCDREGKWTESKVSIFKKWIDGGMPQ